MHQLKLSNLKSLTLSTVASRYVSAVVTCVLSYFGGREGLHAF